MILKNRIKQKIKKIINNYGILVVLKPHKIRHCGVLTNKKMNVNNGCKKIIRRKIIFKSLSLKYSSLIKN